MPSGHRDVRLDGSLGHVHWSAHAERRVLRDRRRRRLRRHDERRLPDVQEQRHCMYDGERVLQRVVQLGGVRHGLPEQRDRVQRLERVLRQLLQRRRLRNRADVSVERQHVLVLEPVL